jgi:SWI/SNF-related matrix-associated actin-dependent regulator of chromatin subfamily A3
MPKRSSEWIDLTGDDEENLPQQKHARVSSGQRAGSSSQPPFSQSLSEPWVGTQAAEEDQDQIIDLSQDVDEGYGWTCVGVVDGKIVGLRYYSGFATVGEVVVSVFVNGLMNDFLK